MSKRASEQTNKRLLVCGGARAHGLRARLRMLCAREQRALCLCLRLVNGRRRASSAPAAAAKATLRATAWRPTRWPAANNLFELLVAAQLSARRWWRQQRRPPRNRTAAAARTRQRHCNYADYLSHSLTCAPRPISFRPTVVRRQTLPTAPKRRLTQRCRRRPSWRKVRVCVHYNWQL